MKLGPRIGVRAVQTLQGFRMLVTFDNNTQREVDFEQLLQGPVFQPMRADPTAFSSVTVVNGVITWPNGADIDPDVLYYGLTPACLE
jgi:hypothetical protein